MPTLLTVGPYRFFCYAGDRDEPPHVHVERDKDEAKFFSPKGNQRHASTVNQNNLKVYSRGEQ